MEFIFDLQMFDDNSPPSMPGNSSMSGGNSSVGGGGTPPSLPGNSSMSGGGTPPSLPGNSSMSGGTPPGSGGNSSSSSITWAGATEITLGGTYSNPTYSSSTSDENSVLIDTDGTVIITNPTVTKTGGPSNAGDNYSFYGINSAVMVKGGGTAIITGGTINSSAAGGNAVFSYGGNGGQNGAAGDGTTVEITGATISTSGDGSGGIMTTGGGKTVARNLTVTTTGQSSAPIRTDRGGGEVSVRGGSFTSSGLGSPAIYSTAAVSVSGAQLTSGRSEGVCIEGQNSVVLTNSTLSANNTQMNGNATFLDSVILYQSQSGDAADGTASFSMTGGAINSYSGHVFHVTNTDAVIYLSGVTINNSDSDKVILSVCDDGWSGASNVATLSAANQTLTGDILVGSDSTLSVNLTNSTSFSGNVSGNIVNASGSTISSSIGAVDVALDSTSKWYLTGDTYITSFSGDAANVIDNGYDLYVNNSILSGTSDSDSVSSALEKTDGVYIYTGGDKTITNYVSREKIRISTTYRGLGLSGNNFLVRSSSGSLTIQNAGGKLMNFVNSSGNTFGYAYLATSGGNLNGGNYSQREVIVGANNSSNNITAGSGGSSLWGGAGSSADTLTGGDGTDVFFYGKNNGDDVINNASSSDTVNLYNVSLSDITSARVSGKKISATFSTGSTLTINSADTLSPTFKLSNGSTWQYNHGSRWQKA